MGIKHLNRFLLDECSDHAIRKIHFAEFSNQIIIVDTSIYMYKFLEKNALLEHMYLLISIFRTYNITPIFIFDGKPPPEKKDVIEYRKQEKKNAEDKFNQLQSQLANDSYTEEGLQEIQAEMVELKKRFIRIKDTDFAQIKALMTAYGIMYFESRGEADQLCAFLVKHNYAWACMSDDMDMFLYGCPRVIRHVSLSNQTATLYDTMRILKELRMNLKAFKEILVLSGTDYNMHDKTSLHETIKYYLQYTKSVDPSTTSFYDWLCAHTAYIHDRKQLDRVNAMFDLARFSLNNNEEIRKIIDCLPFRLGEIRRNDLRQVMHADGFIFV
jgi:5'-3' exonuclease